MVFERIAETNLRSRRVPKQEQEPRLPWMVLLQVLKERVLHQGCCCRWSEPVLAWAAEPVR